MSYLNELSCHTRECEYLAPGLHVHIWMRHVTHMNASSHRREWVYIAPGVRMDVWVSHVAHENKFCHTREWVMDVRVNGCTCEWMYVWMDVRASGCTCEWMYITPDVRMYTWMSRVTHVNESCHTREWVVSHTWMSHLTHVNESCHTRAYIYRTYLSVRTWVQTHSPSQKKTNPGDVFVFAQGYFVISSV